MGRRGASRAAPAWGGERCSDHKFTLSFNWFLDFKKCYNCKASGRGSALDPDRQAYSTCMVIAMEGQVLKRVEVLNKSSLIYILGGGGVMTYI